MDRFLGSILQSTERNLTCFHLVSHELLCDALASSIIDFECSLCGIIHCLTGFHEHSEVCFHGVFHCVTNDQVKGIAQCIFLLRIELNITQISTWIELCLGTTLSQQVVDRAHQVCIIGVGSFSHLGVHRTHEGIEHRVHSTIQR